MPSEVHPLNPAFQIDFGAIKICNHSIFPSVFCGLLQTVVSSPGCCHVFCGQAQVPIPYYHSTTAHLPLRLRSFCDRMTGTTRWRSSAHEPCTPSTWQTTRQRSICNASNGKRNIQPTYAKAYASGCFLCELVIGNIHMICKGCSRAKRQRTRTGDTTSEQNVGRSAD